MSHPRDTVASYPLLDALLQRRSRRFGLGMTMPDSALAHRSRHAAQPIDPQDEALLAWAACGITGPALGDLCYAPGHGGNIMAGMVGRTVASGDCLQTIALAVLNDEGAWLVRRPQDLSPAEIRHLIELGERREWTALYHRSRVQIADHRVQAPLEPIFNINANRWSLHARGSSYFLPIGDLTPMYLNGLLEILNEDTGVFVLDERRSYQPAGLGRFARSRGGHLDDDPAHGRVITIRQLEQFVTDFVNLEMGMVLQNLGLMTQALGLGGFPHFANHEFGWFEALGFECRPLPASRYLGTGPLVSFALRLAGKDRPVPLAIALRRNGTTLLEALSPPNYPTMRHALDTILARKTGPRGAFRDPQAVSAWKDHATVAPQVRPVSEAAIAAATAYLDYVWNRYQRFPVHVPPFRCGLAHQVVHVDTEFYDRHYATQALSDRQRAEFAHATSAAPAAPTA